MTANAARDMGKRYGVVREYDLDTLMYLAGEGCSESLIRRVAISLSVMVMA